MSRLVIRQRADEDLDGQLVYLARQNRDVAERFLEATERTFRILADFPERGFLWDARGIRVWPIRGFAN